MDEDEPVRAGSLASVEIALIAATTAVAIAFVVALTAALVGTS